MGRRASGQVLPRETARGITWALRFQAYGARRYLTLGSERDGWNRERAEEELASVLADVRRAIWTPSSRPTSAGRGQGGPGFHRFASDWFARRTGEISEGGLAYYRWALQHHLLPFFAEWRLEEIDVEAVDEYRRFKVGQAEAARAASGADGDGDRPRTRPLSHSSINKTIEVLQGVLSVAVEYGHIERNPASGRRRRLKVPPRLPAYLAPSPRSRRCSNPPVDSTRGRRRRSSIGCPWSASSSWPACGRARRAASVGATSISSTTDYA